MSTNSSAHTTAVDNARRDAASAPKERWVCDICKVQEFDDFKEACRHEKSCTYGLEQQQKQPVTSDSSSSSSSSNAAFAKDDDDVRGCQEAEEAHVKPAPIAQEHQQFVKTTKEVYVCDICKVVQFDDYDEACRHEECCIGLVAPPAPAAVPPSAEAKAADAKAVATSVPVHSGENVDTAHGDKSAWDGDANDDEVVAVSSEGVAAKKTKINGLIGLATAKANNKVADGAAKSKGTTDAPIFQKRKQPSRGTAASAVAATTSGGGGGKKAKGDAAAAAAAGAEAKANPDAKALASLFTSPRPGRGKGGGKGDGPSPTTAFVQEHRNAEVAAKFAAERRAKAQADRERKRKREEDAMARERKNEKKGGSKKKTGAAAGGTIDDESDAESHATNEIEVVGASTIDKGGSKKAVASIFARPRKRAVPPKSDNGDSTTVLTVAAALVSTSTASAKLKTRPTYLLAPKFPVPSHTIGVNADAVGWEGTETDGEVGEGRKMSCSITADKIANSADALVGTARYQDGRPSLRDCSSAPWNIPLVCDNDIPFYCSDAADELGRAFASVMSPPPVSIDDEGETNEELWSTKYTIESVPDDVCGEMNRESAVSLMKFINEWKAHRAEFVKKMEEKRKSLGSQKRRKKSNNSSRTYYNDDDLWYDSDEDDYGLCNVFLLNGPHGTGKSALVHAAASQAGCVLVEINTTEKRSGSALKRAIEECTQSHSSLALLKRGANPVFSSFGSQTTAKSQEVLSDTSDESDGYDDDEEEEEKDGGDRGRLAIILIDEVDNIFETEGDAGFWVALANLTKKAKCPIILTSTSAPSLLEASSIRYQAASMTRPSPLECASKMRLVAKNEEVVSSEVDDRDDEWGQDELCCIAELCNCDLRSILNEMQLRSHGSSLLRRERKESGGMALDARPPPFIVDAPTITEITPRFVKANSYNVLTIKGDNFADSTDLSATEVIIGGRASLALRIIGDNTILAACAPCTLPKGVDSSGSFEGSFEHCITCRYAPVVVKRTTKTGLVLRSDTCIPSDVSSFGRHFNVVLNFPEVEGRLESMCIKKEKARQKRREESQRALSSDDDDFVIPVRKSKDPENDATTSGRGITNVVSMTSETMGESSLVTTGVDADALLEKAMKDFVLDKSIEQIPPKTCKEQKPRDNEKDLSELTQIVKGLEYSSDAALLEDSFSWLAIPSLSGAVRGFGSDFLDSESLSGNLASGMSSKKLRNTSAKPPTIERIFTSGWNDSAFFFGSSDSYVTRPTSKRDRSELSKAHFYSSIMHSISNTSKSDADDNSKSSSSMSSLTLASSLSNAETNSSSQGSLGTSQSGDDTFLQLCASSPVYSLPSMLRGSAGLPFREHMCLLATRRRERAAEAITSTTALLDDHGTRNSFCFGLNEMTNEEPSDIPIHVNDRFLLDYLPCLKAMAAAENKAEMRYSALKAKNPDALGLQDTTCPRRATRRSAKSGRTHYFDRLVDYNRMHHEEVSALAKRTGTDLSRMILSYSVPC